MATYENRHLSCNIPGIGRFFPSAREVSLLFGSLFIVPVALAQPNDLQISSRVQRHLDDVIECFADSDLDCARASLNKIAGRNLNAGEQYRYRQSLGRVEFFDGNYEGAIASFKAAADLAPSPEARQDQVRYIAQLHASVGQFPQAYETVAALLAERSADQYPRSYQLRSVARQQADVEQFQEAYDTLERLLVLNGSVPLAWRHLTNDALWRGLNIYATGDRNLTPADTEAPAFPREAAARGLVTGFVDLEFTVTRTGSTTDFRVVESSAAEFEAAAIEAAEQFLYKPALENGKPIETPVQRRIEFQLEKKN